MRARWRSRCQAGMSHFLPAIYEPSCLGPATSPSVRASDASRGQRLDREVHVKRLPRPLRKHDNSEGHRERIATTVARLDNDELGFNDLPLGAENERELDIPAGVGPVPEQVKGFVGRVDLDLAPWFEAVKGDVYFLTREDRDARPGIWREPDVC